MTQQHMGQECDINTIMAKAMKTGILQSPGQRPKLPTYGDFSEIGTFQDAHNLVMQARESFMKFPAIIRKKFNNDPGQMLAFLENPENKEEAIKIGLIDAPVASSTVPSLDTTVLTDTK